MSSQRRNVLFISSDQQHWQALGFRNPEIQTPNLDRLAGQGMTFPRAYTVNPTCTPTRASWITGLYPSQHGAYSLGTRLMDNVPTIGAHLQRHGFRTALIGKAHFEPLLATPDYPSLESYPIMHDLDFWREFNGPYYGFEHVELARNHTDEAHVGQHYALWMESKGCKNWRDYFEPTYSYVPSDPPGFPASQRKPLEPGETRWNIPEELHYNAWIAERCNALLDQYRQRNENFFLWASFLDPHPKYMAPSPFCDMYDPAKVTVPDMAPGEFDDKPPYFKRSQQEQPDFSDFEEPDGNHLHGSVSHLKSREVKARNIAAMYGMVTLLDKYVGRILDHLDRLGLTESTLVCFTSDHGDFWGQHGLTAKAIHHYEDLLRVPLIARLPGVIPPDHVSSTLQSTVDLPQTFLSMAGLPVPRTMAGIDQSAVWTGRDADGRDHVIVENQHQPTTMNLRSFITRRYKITIHYQRDYGELYDFEADPAERVNLWDHPDYQTIKRDLLLKFLYGEMAKAPLPMPRVSGA